MATFDDATVGTSTGGTTPDFGAVKKSNPKIRLVKFGDGYEQRLRYGEDQNLKEWNLRWTAKDNTDADAIEAFLDARADDAASFDWSPIGDTETYKWVVASWARTFNYSGVNEITATFRQVVEP